MALVFEGTIDSLLVRIMVVVQHTGGHTTDGFDRCHRERTQMRHGFKKDCGKPEAKEL